MTVRVTRFTFCRRPEHGGDIVVSLDIGLGGKIKVTAVGLGFSREGILEVLFGLASFERHAFLLYRNLVEAKVFRQSLIPKGPVSSVETRNGPFRVDPPCGPALT